MPPRKHEMSRRKLVACVLGLMVAAIAIAVFWRTSPSKSVRIDFLGNWIRNEPAKLEGSSRAIRVFGLIRSRFSDADVHDSRDYDRMVLDAAKLGEFVR